MHVDQESERDAGHVHAHFDAESPERTARSRQVHADKAPTMITAGKNRRFVQVSMDTIITSSFLPLYIYIALLPRLHANHEVIEDLSHLPRWNASSPPCTKPASRHQARVSFGLHAYSIVLVYGTCFDQRR
jgi:hypothetical protein